MLRDNTICRRHEFGYEWAINGFHNYYNFSKSLNYNHVLYSPHFPRNAKYEHQFRLQLKITGDNSSENTIPWISYFVFYNDSMRKDNMTFTLYLLDDKRKKKYVQDFKRVFGKNSVGNSVLIPYGVLLTYAASFIPNDTLTLGCDVLIIEEPVNLPPNFEPKYDQLQIMKKQFNEFLESGNSSDFTFVVNNEKFKVHKIILRARSPVFAAMLDNDMAEKTTNQATINDIRPEIFKLLLKFIYTAEVGTNVDKNIIELFAAADKYQIDNLKEVCMELLLNMTHVGNAMAMVSLTENYYGIDQLITRIKDFIKANKKEILDTLDPEYFTKNVHHAKLFHFN